MLHIHVFFDIIMIYMSKSCRNLYLFIYYRYLTESWGSGDQGRIEQRIIEGTVCVARLSKTKK